MDIQEFAQRYFPEKVREIKQFVESDAKIIMGEEAKQHFEESFVNEGFTDETLVKWPEVERRKPNSPWYGHTSAKEKKYFDNARTTAKILFDSGALKSGIEYSPTEAGVKVFNDRPYAAVHQFGLMAKIYGKTAFQMPARRFVGRSKALKRKIEAQLKSRLLEILKS